MALWFGVLVICHVEVHSAAVDMRVPRDRTWFDESSKTELHCIPWATHKWCSCCRNSLIMACITEFWQMPIINTELLISFKNCEFTFEKLRLCFRWLREHEELTENECRLFKNRVNLLRTFLTFHYGGSWFIVAILSF